VPDVSAERDVGRIIQTEYEIELYIKFKYVKQSIYILNLSTYLE
jgi:hypothetical protein